jgi:hypothetical protein
MTPIVELNDLELSLYRSGERLYREPGFALVRADGVTFGQEALRLSRLHPQQANQQYINRMNADPLMEPVRAAANHADLVYLHLKELAQLVSDPAVLAVPGTLTGDQLGVLLGICQEAGIDVCGFVNNAVAAASTTPAPEKSCYLDVFLQHVLVSELTVEGDIRHVRSFEVKECGFSGLIEGWVNLLADRFVQETRFDPLHTAATEQQLFNQVYDWATGAHHGEAVAVEVVHGEQQRRIEVPRTALEQKAAQRIDRLLDALPAGASLMLSARAARLPGLGARLKAGGFEVVLLTGDAVAAGVDAHLNLIRADDGNLRLVNRLPHDQPLTPQTPQPALAPSHLLKAHRAFALDRTGIALRQTGDGVWVAADPSVTVNGDPVTADRLLCLGDEIVRGSERYTAIRLET